MNPGDSLFLDTNVFIASLTDEPERGDEATKLMNQDLDFYTSMLNLMELRTVLAKKKRVKQPVVEDILEDIADRCTVIPGPDMAKADRFQKETLLYPMDALIYTASEGPYITDSGPSQEPGITVATFDTELLNAAERTQHPADILQDPKFSD